MNYKKLIGIATAVTTIGGYTFAFNSFNSKDGLIRTGIDRIKQVALGYKAQLEELQGRYNSLLADLDSTADALAKAEAKLKQVYEAITGETWNDENGSILDFDFSAILPDQPLPDNPVDGGAIAEILGLPSDASTEDILNAITDLIDTVRTLEQRITALEAEVTRLEAEIEQYETEQDSLVEEITDLRQKLDNAVTEANSIIDNASNEEEAQLDYINDTLEELGEEGVDEPLTEEQQAAKEQYHAVVQAHGWNEEYTQMMLNDEVYPVVESNKFYLKSTTDDSIVKQYDTVSDAMRTIAEAYTAYQEALNN